MKTNKTVIGKSNLSASKMNEAFSNPFGMMFNKDCAETKEAVCKHTMGIIAQLHNKRKLAF